MSKVHSRRGALHGRLCHGAGQPRPGGGDHGGNDPPGGGHGPAGQPEQMPYCAAGQAFPLLQMQVLSDRNWAGDHPRGQGRNESGTAENQALQKAGGRRGNDRPAGGGPAAGAYRLL